MFDRAIEAIINSSDASSIYVGCDSIRFKTGERWFAKYTTVVIVHMDSKHGAKIFYEDDVQPDYGNIKMRMLSEAQYSIAAAERIAPFKGKRHMEIHLDINGKEVHKSNTALKEAMAYVRGMTGMVAKYKPNAWAASRAADQCVKNKLIRVVARD